jgi:hypothetical protein
MTADIAFGDLPPRSERYTRHTPIAEALRARPGQWARIAEYATPRRARHMAYVVRTGRLPAYAPAGAFEAEWREEGARGAVWARYTGTEEGS